MKTMWARIVELHQLGQWQELILLYGVLLALVLLAVLLVILLRGRGMARQALKAAQEAHGFARDVMNRIDDVERRVERRLDTRAGELDARMTKKMDQKGDLIQERIDQRSSTLSDQINKLDSHVSQSNEAIERFKVRIDEVERRIPGLFDKIEEFRNTLARTFQVELSSVLNSFDNSVGAVLHQMKSELQIGVARIESIENMVQSRKQAEQSLLGATPSALSDPSTVDEAPQRLELAGSEEEEEEPTEDDAISSVHVERSPVDDEDDEFMVEVDELDEELFGDSRDRSTEDG